ncbi:BTB/POZ domain-containing protein At4g08455-like [Chenopodium quinoa]|uniref:BTB/POZ domain-containing protein At4g08455-like n=1 Tax=Chenopodium quinoa TaxID=63459 RepID=UPI000B788536|nr:BTB/POZ domain-containing protein At4g08455-like [Chenopodium quinoa]
MEDDRMNRAPGSRKQLSLRCLSCREEYCSTDAGTCKECYEEASETEEELKSEIEDLKAKVAFLRLGSSPLDSHKRSSSVGFSDVVLVASDEFHSNPVSLLAHKAVLASRSPVFKAMLEIEMEESRSGTISISDVSYDALRAFVNYLYTAEACLDEQLACDLLVLAEKYEVKHLKMYCEKFLVSKLNGDNSVASYSFAHQHNANHLLQSALSMIIEDMDNLTKSEEYTHLVEKDPRLVVEIYEAYLSKQTNTAARSD